MARALTPTVPAKMYRHFAVVTIALTATLAMFANGEDHAAAVRALSEKRHESASRSGSHAQFVKPKSARHEVAGAGFAPDSFSADLAPTGGGVAPGFDLTPTSADPLVRAGYPLAYVNSLSEAARKKLLAEVQKTGMLSPSKREQQSAALLSASARRSGVGAAD